MDAYCFGRVKLEEEMGLLPGYERKEGMSKRPCPRA